MSLTRLHCDAVDGVDAGADVTAFAGLVGLNCMVAKITPPASSRYRPGIEVTA